MATYFISDLHIQNPEDALYSKTIRWMNSLQNGDTVILGGDLFDHWVGSSIFYQNLYSEWLKTLKALTRKGVRVFFIEGNHDFLIRPLLLAAGVEYVDREIPLTCEKTRVYFAHGDLVDESNYGYRMLRALFRSLVFRMIARSISGKVMNDFLTWLSRQSRKRSAQTAADISPDHRERMRKIYRSFAAVKLQEGFDCVVLGHCHDLDEMKFKIENRLGQYINIGYPPIHGSILEFSSEERTFFRRPLP